MHVLTDLFLAACHTSKISRQSRYDILLNLDCMTVRRALCRPFQVLSVGVVADSNVGGAEQRTQDHKTG